MITGCKTKSGKRLNGFQDGLIFVDFERVLRASFENSIPKLEEFFLGVGTERDVIKIVVNVQSSKDVLEVMLEKRGTLLKPLS